MPTPRATQESQSLSGLFKKLTVEGIEVVRAELDLARAEAAGITKFYIAGVIICLACFVMAIATVVALVQAVALGLESYLGSGAMAYLITGIVMSILTAILAWVGINILTQKYQPVGTIFKWLGGQRATS